MRWTLVLAAAWCATLQGQSHLIRAATVLDGLGNVASDRIIRIEGGTITWIGPSAAERLLDVARGGLPLSRDSLVSVTSRAAQSLGIADKTGTVAPGMLADLVATQGNPLSDGSALHKVVFAMKAGHVYKEPQDFRKRLILR